MGDEHIRIAGTRYNRGLELSKEKIEQDTSYGEGILEKKKQTKRVNKMKIMNIALSICICFFIFIFLNKYDSWGISEGLCIYHDNSVGVALILSFILFFANFLFLFFFKDKQTMTNIIFIVISIGLLAYWHPVMYNHSINFLLTHTNIHLARLLDVRYNAITT